VEQRSNLTCAAHANVCRRVLAHRHLPAREPARAGKRPILIWYEQRPRRNAAEVRRINWRSL